MTDFDPTLVTVATSGRYTYQESSFDEAWRIGSDPAYWEGTPGEGSDHTYAHGTGLQVGRATWTGFLASRRS